MARRSIDMTNGALLPNIIRFALTVFATSSLQLLFNAADLVVVGQYCGSIRLAAVGATGPITNLIVNLFIGLSVGCGVTVAHALGSGEHHIVHKTVHTAVPTAIICGLFLTVVGILVSEPALIMMGTPEEEVLPLAVAYMRSYFLGMTFNLVYNFCAAMLRASGDTKSPLIFLTISGVINVVLNVIFVTLFQMDVVGVGLATAISQGVSAVLVVITLMKRTDCCRLEWKKLHIYKNQLLRIMRIGIPSGLNSSLFSLSNILIQSSINSFGEIAMSGNAASVNLENFPAVAGDGFNQAAMNFIGQNAGAKKYKRVLHSVLICLGCGFAFTAAFSALIYAFGPQLLGIYITDSAEAIAYGMNRLTWVMIPYCILAIMSVSTGALRGLGAAMVPMIISVLGVCGFRVLWIYTVFQIPAYHTLESIYVSYPISWTLTFLVQILAFIFVYRKQSKEYNLSLQANIRQ